MSIEQLAKKSEVELANIKGIEQNKAIELATVSKLHLDENEIIQLKKRTQIALKKYNYTLVSDKGKTKYFFKDVDIIALKL